MLFFVDTEFTDMINCELISIALVAENGAEFYGELIDFDESACSPFVRGAVLPQLRRFPGVLYVSGQLREKVLEWVGGVSPSDECYICVDNVLDWDILLNLLGNVPAGWNGLLIGHLIDRGAQESYFREHGGRHHALHDARALRLSAPSDLAGAISPRDLKHTRLF